MSLLFIGIGFIVYVVNTGKRQSLQQTSGTTASPAPAESTTRSSRPVEVAPQTFTRRPTFAVTPNASDAYVATATQAPATYRVIGISRGDYLNIREGAGSNYPVVARLEPDTGGITLGTKRTANGETTWQEISIRGQSGWVNADYIAVEHTDQKDAETAAAGTEKMTIEDYFLQLPPDSFEGPPANLLMFMKQPKCGVIDLANGYMSCIGDGAQAPFEVALFRFRDGSALLAVCSGDHGEEGKEDARDGLVFLDFFKLGADKKMHKVSRSIFPVADAGNRKGNWRFELPRYGRMVLVRSQKTGDILHKLTWDGEKFVEER